MKYYVTKPKSSLADYVRYFWVLEWTVDERHPYVHRTFANGCPELLFHYKGTFDELAFDGNTKNSFTAGIHAQSRQYRRFVAKRDFGMIGAYLFPYAIPCLFKIPSTDIANQLPDLHSLLGAEGRSVEDRVMCARSNTERIAIISDFLERRLTESKNPRIAMATRTIMNTRGRSNIDQLADACCLSKRQFERKFKDHCGFSPKTFSRIIRFNSLIERYKTKDQTLTEMAHEFGYFDQSHFIQDFNEFSGYNPRTYFSGKAGETLRG